MMKTLMTFISLCVGLYAVSSACSFTAEKTSFCQSVSYGDALIARGTIMSQSEHSLSLRLAEVYRGEEQRCIITVFSRPEINCTGVIIKNDPSYFGEIGQTVLFFAQQIVEKIEDYEIVGEYRNPYIEFVGFGIPSEPLIQVNKRVEGFFSDRHGSVKIKQIHQELQNCEVPNLLPSPRVLCSEGLLKVYPNPVQDMLFIAEDIGEEVGVGIYDLRGRLVLGKESHARETGIPIANIPSGMYILVVNARGVIFKQKIIVRG